MKILVIRFGSLGDLILTLPALGDLQASVQPEIHWLLLEEYRELMRPLPQLHRIWTLPRGADRKALNNLAKDLDAEGFDLVLDFHLNLRSRLLRRSMSESRPAWASTRRLDLRRRLMLSRPGWPSGWRPSRPLTPVAERHRQTLRRALGERYQAATEFSYPIAPDLRQTVDGELAKLGLDTETAPLGIAPGSAWPEKIWPRYAEFLGEWGSRTPVLLFGGPGEEELCRELAAAGSAMAYTGRPLPEVAAALARCRVLLTGDTGLGHLAEAVGRPVLSLFGPTVPAFGFAPRGEASRVLERSLPCRPCSLHGEKPCRYGHRGCLADLSATEVLRVLEAMAEGIS